MKKKSSIQKQDKDESVKLKTMYVMNKVIRYEDEVFNIENITRIGWNKLERKKENKNKIKNKIIRFMALFFGILGLALILSSGGAIEKTNITILLLGIFFIVISESPKKEKKEYILFFELNSGRTANFIANNRRLVKEVFSSITEVMKKENFYVTEKIIKKNTFDFTNVKYKVDNSIRIGGNIGGSVASGNTNSNITSKVQGNVQ